MENGRILATIVLLYQWPLTCDYMYKHRVSQRGMKFVELEMDRSTKL